jgi:hypothetical protein
VQAEKAVKSGVSKKFETPFYFYMYSFFVRLCFKRVPKIGIHKKVTIKWARQTWVTIARSECRINKDYGLLCLVHEDTDNKVTDMYIKYDYSIIDESNRKVIDFINLNWSSLDVSLNNV